MKSYLSTKIHQFKSSEPIIVKQFNHGQSNPTFLLSIGPFKCVLRKRPPGKLLRGAHAVDREYMIQSCLFKQGFPVPEPLHFCEDTSVIGTDFYVMQFMEGRIFLDQNLAELSPDERSLAYDQLIKVMA